MKKTIPPSAPRGQIRIIAGRHRGKILPFPVTDGLRPTPDRIRETVFNWLMHDIQNARCLDLFAGSGALGFEAYSRGAASIVLIEAARPTYLNLKKIAAQFDNTAISVFQQSALEFLHQNQNTQSYDIIFVDPPFAQPELLDCIRYFEKSNCLVASGLLYVESRQDIGLCPKLWQKLRLKKAGQVTYALYQKLSTDPRS